MFRSWKKAWAALSGRTTAPEGINCEELTRLLIDYVDGNLPDEDRIRLDGHFKDCPNCFSMMKTYRKTIDLTQSAPQSRMPSDVRERLKRFLEEKMQGR